jgi:chemotaxis regulatin CheY-phosphate phosphatase CheZ
VIDIIDLERQEIKNMLEVLPDVESRVIGVINKCDMKQKKSHDFVSN